MRLGAARLREELPARHRACQHAQRASAYRELDRWPLRAVESLSRDRFRRFPQRLSEKIPNKHFLGEDFGSRICTPRPLGRANRSHPNRSIGVRSIGNPSIAGSGARGVPQHHLVGHAARSRESPRKLSRGSEKTLLKDFLRETFRLDPNDWIGPAIRSGCSQPQDSGSRGLGGTPTLLGWAVSRMMDGARLTLEPYIIHRQPHRVYGVWCMV